MEVERCYDVYEGAYVCYEEHKNYGLVKRHEGSNIITGIHGDK